MARALLPTSVVLALFGAVGLGCHNYSDQLDRAQDHFQNARYEAALANLEDMERDLPHLDAAERTRYEYLRGMSYFRLQTDHADPETRDQAHHWLVVAWEDEQHAPGALTEEWSTTLNRTIAQLDHNADHMLGDQMPSGTGAEQGDGGVGAAATTGASSGGESGGRSGGGT